MLLQRLNTAIHHRECGEYEQAQSILSELLSADPNNPIVNYQMAWLCDVQGKEREAVSYYETAIQNMLEGEDLRGALLGLGSTYRCLGRYDDAIATLQKGMKTFPTAYEFPVFLAMAFYNRGQHADAMSLLLQQLANSTGDEGILRFKNAILFYHDKLDQLWE